MERKMCALAKYLALFSIFALVFNSAYSLKCYRCSGSSLVGCEKNQTVQDCNNIPCGTLKLVLARNGIPIYTSYTKTCALLSNCTQYFNSTGMVLSLHSCQMITRCSTDYCNGERPTTPLVTSSNAPETSTQVVTQSPKSVSAKMFSLLPLYFAAALFSWVVRS